MNYEVCLLFDLKGGERVARFSFICIRVRVALQRLGRSVFSLLKACVIYFQNLLNTIFMAIKMEIDKKGETQVTKAEARKAARKVLKLKAKKKDISKEEKELYETVRNYIQQTGDREIANDVEVYQRTTQKLEKVSDDADMDALIEELEGEYPETVNKKISLSELEKAWDEHILYLVKRHGFTVAVSETEYVKSKV